MLTRFVLINTSHAGNVGAVARAMKVMGFDDLVLVAPRWSNVLRREESIQRASGALDVLAKARIVETLDEALDGVTHLCATAMTPRDFGPPTRGPREHFRMLLNEKLPTSLQQGDMPDFSNSVGAGIGFLFGSERFGMVNEDVYRCHVALSIPSNPKFGSLNLGAAVQLIAYEWRMALGGFASPAAGELPEAGSPMNTLTGFGEGNPVTLGALADARQISGMLSHLERALVDIGFLDPAAPKKLMPRLNQMFNRAQLVQEEIHILRGIAKAMARAASRADGPR